MIPDVLSIRDKETLKSDDTIRILREATIRFINTLIDKFEKDPESKRELDIIMNTLIDFLNGDEDLIYEGFEDDHFNIFSDLEEVISFLLDLGFKGRKEMLKRLEEVENCIFMECLTSGRCFESVVSLGDYILEKYPDVYDVYPLVITGELESFGAHAVLVLKDRKTDMWYLSNPSNIFDTNKLPDMTDFQRPVHILRATNYNSLVKLITEIDGGELPDESLLPSHQVFSPGIVF